MPRLSKPALPLFATLVILSVAVLGSEKIPQTRLAVAAERRLQKSSPLWRTSLTELLRFG